MLEGIRVYLEFKTSETKDGKPKTHEYIFRPPEGMNFDRVVEFLDSQVGRVWQDDEDAGFHERTVQAVYDGQRSDVYILFESMTREDIAKLLEDKGFVRIDNYQDHLDPFARQG